MIKILIINTVSFRFNGISTIIMNYFLNMEKNDFEIHFLVTSKENVFESLMKENHAIIHYIPRKKNLINYIKKLNQLMKQEKFDIVHVNGQSSFLALELFIAKKNKVKLKIAHSHNDSCNHKVFHYFLKPIFYKTYDVALACSYDAGKWLFGDNDFTILHNGISINRFAYSYDLRKKIRKNLGINLNTYVIGHVGIFNKQKNQRFLVELFYDYQKINFNSILLMVGYGEKKDEIYNYVKKLNLIDKVIFINPTSKIEELYNCMDIFVLPSLWEGLGIVNVEAQANGLPCLVSTAITNEVKCLEDRFFAMELNETSYEWALMIEKIRNKNYNRNIDTSLYIKNKCFDINEESNKLRDVYINYLRGEK